MRSQSHHILLLVITWGLTLTPLPAHSFMSTMQVCNRHHRRLTQEQNSRAKPVSKEDICPTTSTDDITARTRTQLSEKFQLQLSNNNNNEENDNDAKEFTDPLLILPLATSGAILGLILFVLYTKFTNPATDFDIDFYMALDDMTTNTASGNGGGGIGGGYYGNPDGVMAADTILGLPKLSPAENIVGALFGPPSIP